MPKDEFDFEDPFELNGMALLTQEDTSPDMAECFIVEFMRMGYGHKQLLALFRNPQYLGPNLVYRKRGEAFIRDLIGQVFARWGRNIAWTGRAALSSARRGGEETPINNAPVGSPPCPAEGPEASNGEDTDPMGSPIPKLNL